MELTHDGGSPGHVRVCNPRSPVPSPLVSGLDTDTPGRLCTGTVPGAPAGVSERVHRAGAWCPGRRLSVCTGPAPGAQAGVSECVHRAGAWRPSRRLEFHRRGSRSSVRTAVVLEALLFFQTYARVSAVILSTGAVLGHVSFPSALPLACRCSVCVTAPCLTFKLYRVISKLACLTAGWET